jgi:hypothetical protein
MPTRRHVVCSGAAPWPGAWSCTALVERRVVRRGGAHGVAAQQSAGCAGRGCGADRCGQECAA